MSQAQPTPSNCVSSCVSPQTVAVPGPPGTGTDGTNGTNGVNAYSLLTSGFTQPAVSGTVTVNVTNSSWMALGQVLFVQGGGYYTLSGKPSLTQATLTNLGYTGNAAPGAAVATLGYVSPGGIKGFGTPLSGSASLDFGAIGAQSQADLTISVTGAVVNDVVILGLPSSPTSGIVYMAFVSAADTVKVRASNITGGSINPNAATFTVQIPRP